MDKRKRRRTRNTGVAQYKVFVKFMENDYNFRNNTTNTTLGDNYVENKWKDLCVLLNGTGDGPQLTVDEWKKRFIDWKYAVHMKFRKINLNRNKPSKPGAPTTEIKLSEIEERALRLWGKVEPSKLDELNVIEASQASEPVGSSELEEIVVKVEEETETEDQFYQEESTDSVWKEEVESLNCSLADNSLFNSENNVEAQTKVDNSLNKGKRRKVLSDASQQCDMEGSNDLNSVLRTIADEYIKFKNDKNKIEMLRLRFEIEKYKFENPNFSFNV